MTVVALAFASASGPGPGAAADVIPVSALDTVITRVVRGGRVDYAGLSRDPGPLRRFLARAERAHPERHGRAARMAFWINVYNARVLDEVIRRPGIRSVMDSLPGALAFFRQPRQNAGAVLSLDQIERDRLRSAFGDPRVHFVLNCASASCPDLPPRALTAATLDSALDAGVGRFLADRSKNRLAGDGVWELSSIFQWYREDFSKAGGVVSFVLRYRSPSGGRSKGPVRFLPYDWSLNGQW